jgi:hypothetical protein
MRRSNFMQSTPTFFVSGRIQDVSFGLLALFEAVADELQSITSALRNRQR